MEKELYINFKFRFVAVVGFEYARPFDSATSTQPTTPNRSQSWKYMIIFST